MSFANRLWGTNSGPPQRSILFADSLASRLTKWFIGSSFLLIAIVSSLLYWGTIEGLNWADDQVLEKRMLAMRDQIQGAEPNQGMIAHEVDEDVEGPRQIFIRVKLTGTQTSHETTGMDEALRDSAFPDVVPGPFDTQVRSVIRTANDREFRALTVKVPQSESYAVIQLATDTTLDERVLSWFRKLLAAVVGLAMLLGAVAGWQIVRRQLLPLEDIAVAASGIKTSTLNYRLKLDGMPDELRALGEEFNLMLGRLETAYAGLSSYADNIAHEIRSPLNRIQVGTEVILSKPRDIAEYRSALESNMEECQRLTRLVQGLMFLARAENARMTIQKDTVDLDAKLADVQSFFEEPAREQEISFTVSCPDGLAVQGDGVLVQRAISNLISNALSHTPRGGKIDVRVEKESGALTITVSDTGEGIPAEHQPHIFDRFYRVDDIRSAESGRLGLGLAITKSIVALHGGTIFLRSSPGAGTVVKLVFPTRSDEHQTIVPKTLNYELNIET